MTRPSFHDLARSWAVATVLALATALMPAAPLEQAFDHTPESARPFVWWHWMGPNFSREGITRDLEAMAAAGIGGATIFNLTSAVQETQAPTRNNPWPHQTYRSPAYWDALRHAVAAARRVGIELGLHNTVGYSTTGGPWIDEARGIQQIVWREVTIDASAGAIAVDTPLPRPVPPTYAGYGSLGQVTSHYRDIGVVAVPLLPDASPVPPGSVVDLSTCLGPDDRLRWNAPAGRWRLFRFGHAPTGVAPHPVPDDLIGRVLEADKISVEQTRFDWSNVLEPLEVELGRPVGAHLRHFLIDSYEAGHQGWSPGLRSEFIHRLGYDPLRWLPTLGEPLIGRPPPSSRIILGSDSLTARFEHDFRTLLSDLFLENGWKIGAAAIRRTGAELHFEPYTGPFDTIAGAALADVPMGEFWSGGTGWIDLRIPAAARAAGRGTVGAEAFTGRPEVSPWTETPAFLKKSADGAFTCGVNRLYLHHWVHQPFPDHLQPGMGMGWWGTHFGRNQTWFEPGFDFFRYLGRIQALLQRGQTPASHLSVGTAESGGDAISWRTFHREVSVTAGAVTLPSGQSYRLLHVPHTGALLPADVQRIANLLAEGATIVAPRPVRSPGLSGYPDCDIEVQTLALQLWGPVDAPGDPRNGQPRQVNRGRLYTSGNLQEALRHLGTRRFTSLSGADLGDVRSVHRRDGDTDIVFIANLNDAPRTFTARFDRTGASPELWDPERGSRQPAQVWRTADGFTEVDLHLRAGKSTFVILRPGSAPRHAIARAELDAGATVADLRCSDGAWSLAADAPSSARLTLHSGDHLHLKAGEPARVSLRGPWKVTFRSPVDRIPPATLHSLVSLSELDSPSTRFFAGTATYSINFNLPAGPLPDFASLDLGEVHSLAHVTLNGNDLGVGWHPPFRWEIAHALVTGSNTLEIAVTTTWHNRLAGDEREPPDFEFGPDRGPTLGRPLAAYPEWFLRGSPRPSERKGFVTWFYHRGDTPLLPAGLLGPVQVILHPATTRTDD